MLRCSVVKELPRGQFGRRGCCGRGCFAETAAPLAWKRAPSNADTRGAPNSSVDNKFGAPRVSTISLGARVPSQVACCSYSSS